jgi:hypothetical protein
MHASISSASRVVVLQAVLFLALPPINNTRLVIRLQRSVGQSFQVGDTSLRECPHCTRVPAQL